MKTKKRLIDIDEIDYENLWGSLSQLMKFHDFLEKQPTVDAVEVVHGRWLKTRESVGWGEFDCVECSACHETWIMDKDCDFDDSGYWKYCPSCGATMDGETL